MLIVFGINGSLIKFALYIMDSNKNVSFLVRYIENHSYETSNLRPRGSPTPSRIFSLFRIFLLTFLRLHIETDGVFFHAVADNPSRGLLTRMETVRLSKRPRGRKGGPEYRLFFMLKQPHAPRRPYGALFRQIGWKISLLATYATDKLY